MKILITGADGFLGWHTRVRVATVGGHEVVPVTRGTWNSVNESIIDVDAVIHVAGVNRGTPTEVEEGNAALARTLAAALSNAERSPQVVFANSIQCGEDSPYGRGKARASESLASAALDRGLRYVDIRLPNLFGEHGRPNYNSFVQTFVSAVMAGRSVRVDDRRIVLLHVQQAAQALIDGATSEIETTVEPLGTEVGVGEVLTKLRLFRELYQTGDIPPLEDDFAVDLFNTYRAAVFPGLYPVRLPVRQDHRGGLVEVVRAHGGQGQTFVSTTVPGAIRGEHFHLRKIERFVVLRGKARISLRRLYHRDVITFDVDGNSPGMIDMPTMWAHNITNTGHEELTTLFWTNELFDPERPDTFPCPVEPPICAIAGV